MRATSLKDLLSKKDRVAVSNITGREASKVSIVSQRYAGNIVGGWALGKGGQKIEVDVNTSIPVFSDYAEMLDTLKPENYPNKIIIYSPPDAVYGDVKSVVNDPRGIVETIFIITENVAIEVAAKVKAICAEKNIDVFGCNTLGLINTHEQVRVGAVGGDQPEETFQPGSTTIISNSGNMVNTMATYLNNAGIGIRFGISTGKDQLILTPLKDILSLVAKDEKTKLVVLYIEPGGLYEKEAIQWMKKSKFSKPIVVYVGGSIAEGTGLSLGHAGAVVEGKGTSATDKMALFDEYLEVAPFSRGKKSKDKPKRGVRIQELHDLPEAARYVYDALKIQRDFKHYRPLKLNPWMCNLGSLILPSSLILGEGVVPPPFADQFLNQRKNAFGASPARRVMRNASHASSNDGITPRLYGYSTLEMMKKHSFSYALITAFTGNPPTSDFECQLVDQTLIAAITNGPGTISAQGAKLSASAGNEPNTAIIATMACIGTVHGGNGSKAVQLLIDAFAHSGLTDPYDPSSKELVAKVALETAQDFLKRKKAAKESDGSITKIPCLGHPVYRNDAVNYDPRERIVNAYMESSGIYHAFVHFYHELAANLCKLGVTRNVLAVNVDAIISCVWLGICWKSLHDKKMTVDRAKKIAFLGFAIGRAAGGAAEYLDHCDYGQDMDMRIPVSECQSLSMLHDDI